MENSYVCIMDEVNFEDLFAMKAATSDEKGGLFVCLSGEADALFNDKVFHLSRGVVRLITPLVIEFPISQTDDFEGIYILADLAVLYPLIHANMDIALSMNILQNPCCLVKEADIEFFVARKQLIDAKEEALARSSNEYERRLLMQMVRLLKQETILEMINIFHENTLVEPKAIGKDKTLVYKFLYSLHQDYKWNRSVRRYAADANLSVGRFTAVVKQATGRTPSEWVSLITILNAKVMLEKTDKRIKEIAEDLNFPEQFTFNKYFRHYTGISPRAYRSKHSSDIGKT